MKTAGTKNDGAWFRLNKALRKMRDDPTTADQIYDLSTKIYGEEPDNLLAQNAFQAIQDLATSSGVTPPESPANASAWVTRLVEIGIPRQVWMGRLSFTTYSRSGSTGDFTYTANFQGPMHAFAKRLRKVCKNWLKARRAFNDLTDTGNARQNNPGGQPDATFDPAE